MNLRSEISGALGFMRGLPGFLRQPMSPDEAREIVLRRLRERASNFVRVVQVGVFENPRSPYRAMFELAGCDLGDLKQMVEADGVEPTLRALRAAGVYVSFDEFKGTRPIERQGRHIPARAEDFDNPKLERFHAISTGGSTGAGRRVLLDLAHLRARLPMLLLGDVYHGAMHVPNVFWFEIPPGNGLDSVLLRVPAQNIPERWFTPIRGTGDGAAWRFRLATNAIVAVARMSGAKIPLPEYLPLDRAATIARWAEDAIRRRGACVIHAHVSKALRVCLAARELGIDLTGAVVHAGGEPPTPAKVAQIRASGARFHSKYYFAEVGPVGMSCTTSDEPNDQHLFHDHLALIQAPRVVPGFDVSVDAFNYTTLLPTAPKLLINVESDDYGIVETRHCGCPFESLGFTTHVRDIRSFRKLTGEGVTLIGSDIERILEEDLPARFGGSPLDFQIVEEEDERGFTRLTILAHPRLQIADDQAVVETVLASLARRGEAAEMSKALWGQAGTFRVRREVPSATARGKHLTLRVVKRSAAAHELPSGVRERVAR